MSWIPSYKKPSGGSSGVPSWSDGTDEEIVAALEAHYNGNIDLTEYWAVGDERIVHIDAISYTWPYPMSSGENNPAQDIVLVLSNIGGKTLASPINGISECLFIVSLKNALSVKGPMEAGTGLGRYWDNLTRRTWCNSYFYNAFPNSIKSIFKYHLNTYKPSTATTVDYFALPSEYEVMGFNNYGDSMSRYDKQFEWYKTASNRIKDVEYWTRSATVGNLDRYVYINSSGSSAKAPLTNYYGIAPFGVI